MEKKKRTIALLIINLFIFVSTVIIATIGMLSGASSGQVGEDVKGLSYFKPYTTDSNILLGVSALILSVFYIRKLTKGKEVPSFVFRLYYVSVTSILLTILTVIFFLFPSVLMAAGFERAVTLFLKDMFFFHLLNPVLAVITFFMNREKTEYRIKDNLLGILPMFIYSIVYLLNVVILKNWSDFYGFTFGGNNKIVPFVMIAMYLFTYLFGFAIRKIKKHLS